MSNVAAARCPHCDHIEVVDLDEDGQAFVDSDECRACGKLLCRCCPKKECAFCQEMFCPEHIEAVPGIGGICDGCRAGIAESVGELEVAVPC